MAEERVKCQEPKNVGNAENVAGSEIFVVMTQHPGKGRIVGCMWGKRKGVCVCVCVYVHIGVLEDGKKGTC